MWFSSKLNGKDHLERIHKFREGQGYSFYDCLRKFGLEWFSRRSFFEEREVTGQALWMDLALARRSGPELRNQYVITNSPVMAHLRRFFRAAVRDLTAAYEGLAIARADEDIQPSICDQMRLEIAQGADDFDPLTNQASGYEILDSNSSACAYIPTQGLLTLKLFHYWYLSPDICIVDMNNKYLLNYKSSFILFTLHDIVWMCKFDIIMHIIITPCINVCSF